MEENENALMGVAKDLIPANFSEKYRALKKLQEEVNAIEDEVKKRMIEMFESIPGLESNTVTVDGIKFTYVGPSVRKTIDSKKLKEEHPDIYKKMLKESQVKSSIRTQIEY